MTAGPVAVGYDGSPAAHDALVLGARLAGVLGAPLLAVCVHPPRPLTSRVADPSFAARGPEAALELLDAAAVPAGVALERLAIAATTPEAGLHEVAGQEGAALLVVGSSPRHGPGRTLLGSTAQRAVHNAPCPVVVAPTGYGAAEPRALSTVGLAYDGSGGAAAAVPLAVGLARRAGAELRVIRAVAPMTALELAPYGPAAAVMIGIEPARRRARESVDALHEDLPADVRCTSELPEGTPADALRDATARLDVLVIGSHARGTLGRLVLGSTSSRVLDGAHCPVVLVPASWKGGDVA